MQIFKSSFLESGRPIKSVCLVLVTDGERACRQSALAGGEGALSKQKVGSGMMRWKKEGLESKDYQSK